MADNSANDFVHIAMTLIFVCIIGQSLVRDDIHKIERTPLHHVS